MASAQPGIGETTKYSIDALIRGRFACILQAADCLRILGGRNNQIELIEPPP
jgi:hypothetical protein